MWNGNAWVNTGQFDNGFNHINGTDTGGFWAGAGWVGTSGRAVAVYSDQNTGQINYATWTAAGGWVVQADVAVPGMGTQRMHSVQIESCRPEQAHGGVLGHGRRSVGGDLQRCGLDGHQRR
jgi:hypothetical protein